MAALHRSLLTLSLALLALLIRSGNCQAYSFKTYDDQCNTAGMTFPHLSYDSSRWTNRTVVDGLELQYKLLRSATEDNAQSYFIPRDDSNSPVDPATIAILRKLLKLVQQRDIVMAMPEGEQLRVYGTVITMLDILANETCELLRTKLQGRYREFSCTSAVDISDTLARLELYELVRRYKSDLRNLAGFVPDVRHIHQCSYWNTRVLGGCSNDYQVTPEEVAVHRNHIKPIYIDETGVCGCPDPTAPSPTDSSSPLCEIQ